MMGTRVYLWSLAVFFVVLSSAAAPVSAERPFIILATTTSTENSGLLAYLNPEFTKDTGIEVRVIARGTGASLELARNGDADVVLVHARNAEDKFIAEGYGVRRYAVMHNDFVLLGPPEDPAGVKGMEIRKALAAIAEKEALFVSRGDNSGTCMKEQSLWKTVPVPSCAWYLSVGQGMGKTLTIADQKNAYTLSDRGTYLAYRDRIRLVIVSEGSPLLFNPYSVIPVNPEKNPAVRYESAEKYARWLVSEKAQRLIAAYKVKGEQLFFPDAVTGGDPVSTR